VVNDDTAYVSRTAPAGVTETAPCQPAPRPVPAPPTERLRYMTSLPAEEGGPGKAAPPAWSPPKPALLVGRKERAMPLLRQQQWNQATQPVVVMQAPPPNPWTRWLPALGGGIVGVLLVVIFYLAILRPAPAASRRPPPRGYRSYQLRPTETAARTPAPPAPQRPRDEALSGQRRRGRAVSPASTAEPAPKSNVPAPFRRRRSRAQN
jgi:hypothetical protein